MYGVVLWVADCCHCQVRAFPHTCCLQINNNTTRVWPLMMRAVYAAVCTPPPPPPPLQLVVVVAALLKVSATAPPTQRRSFKHNLVMMTLMMITLATVTHVGAATTLSQSSPIAGSSATNGYAVPTSFDDGTDSGPSIPDSGDGSSIASSESPVGVFVLNITTVYPATFGTKGGDFVTVVGTHARLTRLRITIAIP